MVVDNIESSNDPEGNSNNINDTNNINKTMIKEEDKEKGTIDTQSVPSQGSDFVKKLFTMLEENRFDNIVNWSDNGDSFLIMDTNEFTKQVLPCYFKHSNFSSFVRQLNKYGFHKVKISNEAKQKYQLENVWEFKHPDFNRFDKSSIENIKRKIPVKKDSNDNNSNNNNCNHLNSIRRLEDRINYLEKENSNLTNNITNLKSDSMKLNQKYNTLVVNLLTSKDINMSLSRSIECLYNSILQLGGRVSSEIEFPHLDLMDSNKLVNNQNTNINTNPNNNPTNPAINNDNNINNNNTNNNNHIHNNNTHSNINGNNHNQSIPNTNKSISVSPINNQIESHHSNQNINDNNNINNDPNTHLHIKSEPFDSNDIKLTSPNNALSEQERIRNRPKGSIIHILLVEDDDICIQLCRKFLIKYGCTVVVVNDGLSAISAVEQVKFDFILMDIVMPNLDGATATSVIRSFDRDTPIIAMTGSYHRKDLAHYSSHGMTDILGKPFTKDDLYMILKKHNINPVIIDPPSAEPMQGHVQGHGHGNGHGNGQVQVQVQAQGHPQVLPPQQVQQVQQQNNNTTTTNNNNIPYNTITRKRASNPNDINSLNTIPIINTNNETLLTPSILQPTGMTPDVSVFTNPTNIDGLVVPSEVDVQEALATVDMDLLNVPDSEYGSMFKRQRNM